MIDLKQVRDRLEWALTTVDTLSGIDVVDTDTGNPSSGRKRVSERERAAALSRELLHLADCLDLTGSLVREQYWSMKGLAP